MALLRAPNKTSVILIPCLAGRQAPWREKDLLVDSSAKNMADKSAFLPAFFMAGGLRMTVLLGALSLLFFFLAAPNLQAAEIESLPRIIFYDAGNANESVAVLGSEILELGSHFERYRVIGFESDAIILEDMQSREGVKLPESGETEEALRKNARHLFIVKQLRAVFRAQQAYWAKYGDHFARDLSVLIREELLPDGFQESFIKQGYQFKISSTQSDYGKEADFLAVAVPETSLQPDWLFSVDGLGQVRYADTLEQISWGPVWEYSPVEQTPSHFIGVDDPSQWKGIS